MPAARSRIDPATALFLGAASIVGVLAGALTLLVEWRRDESMLPLFYPLAPGLMTGLLITRAHGGTHAQELVAPWVAAFVNACSYFALLLLVRGAWRLLMNRPSAYKAQKPDAR